VFERAPISPDHKDQIQLRGWSINAS